jgi:Poly-adenylate binding protein, unique domain
MPKPQPVTQTAGQTKEEFAYAEKIQELFSSAEYKKASEHERKQLIGDLIYDHVETVVHTEWAPKVTGMILGVGLADLVQTVLNYKTLYFKIRQAESVLLGSA